ncbi:hypothetical protein ACIRLA_21800 [Streptomyces sp. NPDC102364]|uniref:hypothetical protein n=1 Tax=Streptomyces sp. NPDC102364 TaxID=3366161 RepID=UPI0038208E08
MATFTDDFNRADGTNLGAGWVEVSGDWTIVSNQLTPGVTASTVVLRAATTLASSDHYAQVTIAATTSVSQGVWCRGNLDITNGYLWRNNGSNWSLFSVVADSYTSIGSYSAAAAPGDVAKIQAVGSTIKGFVNGIERVSVVNTAVTTGTSVGIRSEANTALRFDAFTAADVSTGTTLTLGTANTTETAQALTGTKTATLATATEAGGAQTFAGTKTATLNAVAEQAAAQPLFGAKAGTLGPAGTIESAQPLTGSKTAILPTAVEQGTAQALAGMKTDTLDLAGTIEAAQPLTGAKTATLPTALETCTARPLTKRSTATPSPERTIRIPAEQRRLVVPAESRTLTVR